jgi:hydroxymethylpyrimidine/phosphomethylpyrimidine kinase
MLGDAATVELVARLIGDSGLPAVVDPVMVAKGGAALLENSAISALQDALLPQARLLTPNAPEASALSGVEIATTDDLRRAGARLLAMGPKAVLMKGGHVEGEEVTDILMTAQGETLFSGPRLRTRHTHGTGCTLASAIAAGLAGGLSLEAAVTRARHYLMEALRTAPGYGAGHGPLNHAARRPQGGAW